MTKVRRILVIAAISTFGVMSVMAAKEMRKPTDQESTAAKVEELHPFTHIASIPAGSDLSSIRFEEVRIVRVATQKKSVIDARSCEEAANRDSGGSIRCSYPEFQSPSPAYEVTYSYHGQPLTSDESGGNRFTFSVYLRADEISPAMLKTLSENKKAKAAAADFFALTTYRDPVRSGVIDEAASAFCDGNFIDGSWTRTDRKCGDKIVTRAITAPSNYITVKVELTVPGVASNSPR